jgi:hypothetical protein
MVMEVRKEKAKAFSSIIFVPWGIIATPFLIGI